MILCLVSNSVFVSFLLLITLFFLSLFIFYYFFVLLFSPMALVQLDRPPLMRTSLHMYVHYTWGLLVQKLAIIL